jgi:hypothetical protein
MKEEVEGIERIVVLPGFRPRLKGFVILTETMK